MWAAPKLDRCGSSSDDAVGVRRLGRDRVVHVPVLDDLFAVDAEDVNVRASPFFRRGDDMGVDDDMVAVDEHAADVDARLWVALAQHELAQAVDAVGGVSAVLDVDIAEVRGCGGEVTTIDHRLVEVEHDSFGLPLDPCRTSLRW